MKIRFARFLLALVCLAFATASSAQAWPAAKPIRIVIAFGPGSNSDILARMIGERLQKALGQTVIVDAKPGASGQIAAEHVARSPADGYTLFMTTNTTHSANPYLFKSLSYDPIKDFTPIVRIGYFPFVLLVNSTSPVQDVKGLLAYAKANPKALSYSYTSSAGQIAAAALSNSMKMDAIAVPYKSAPEAINSLIGDQVSFTVLDFLTTQPAVKAGRLRPLAVTTEVRTALAPSLPTIAEATGLKDFGVVAWQGIFGPANLPAPIVESLSAELQKILSPSEMQQQLSSMGGEPALVGPDEFAAFVKNQLRVWERQIRIAGIQPE